MATKITGKRTMRFTQATLDALKPADKRTFYYDDKQANLGVNVNTSGKLTFFVRCTVNGATKRIGIPSGNYPAMTIETAREKARELSSSVAKGTDPVRERRADKAAQRILDLTVKDAVDAFCEGKERRLSSGQKMPLKDGTKYSYRKTIQALLGKEIYEKPLVKLDEATLARRVQTTTKTVGATGCRSLSSVWNWTSKQAAYRGHLPPNPVKEYSQYHDGLHVPAPRDRRIPLTDLPAFLTSLEALRPYQQEALLWLSLTGNRLGEMMGLQWGDIDWRHSEYVLHDPKNRRRCTLPIPSTLITPLRRRRKAEGDVFNVSANGLLKDIGDAIGLKLSPHDLRRTHAGICASVLPEVSAKRLQNRVLNDVWSQYVGTSANLHDELAKVEREFYRLAGKPLKNVKHLEAVK